MRVGQFTGAVMLYVAFYSTKEELRSYVRLEIRKNDAPFLLPSRLHCIEEVEYLEYENDSIDISREHLEKISDTEFKEDFNNTKNGEENFNIAKEKDMQNYLNISEESFNQKPSGQKSSDNTNSYQKLLTQIKMRMIFIRLKMNPVLNLFF